jgi:[ribosomal protein S5]-alanine N-acetyltransferase
MIKKNFKKQQGSSVKLTFFDGKDITQNYISWLNDPFTTQYSNQRFCKHDYLTCQKYLSSFAGTNNLFLAIRRIDNNEMIGTMTAYFNDYHGVVDIGIMIGNKSEWGKGYGQDAWDTLLFWLLSMDCVRKVTAGTLTCNFGMLKIIECSGMNLECTKKLQEVVKGEPVDVAYYSFFNDTQRIK